MTSLTSQPQLAVTTDPWDAPYFGGPIYLRFPDFTGPTTSGVSEPKETSPNQSATEMATPEPSQPVASRDIHYDFHLTAYARVMDGNDGSRTIGDRRFDQLRVDVQRISTYIDEHGHRTP